MERDTICSVCGEIIPAYSRLCPVCFARDSFTTELDAEKYSPIPNLNILRSYVDEALALPPISLVDSLLRHRAQEITMRELVASFETVEFVIISSFGREHSVASAIEMMYEILRHEVDLRRRRVRRVRQATALGLLIALLATIIPIFF